METDAYHRNQLDVRIPLKKQVRLLRKSREIITLYRLFILVSNQVKNYTSIVSCSCHGLIYSFTGFITTLMYNN